MEPEKYLASSEDAGEALPSVKPSAKKALPDITFTAVQVGDAGRQVVNCGDSKCKVLPEVDSADTQAVTDGESWYYYEYRQDEKTGREVLQLKRRWIDSGETVLVTEQTPLVTPRGLYISPDGQRLAFWLDGDRSSKKPLTELWVYDAREKGKKLLAEKIVRSDVVSEPRWNWSSTLLWFVGDAGQQDDSEKLGLHVVAVKPPWLSVKFPGLSQEKIRKIMDGGVIDLDLTGESLVLAENNGERTLLGVYQKEGLEQSTTMLHGSIPYVRWLEDGSILYAIQGRNAITLWQLREAVHRHVIRQQGELESIRADAQGNYLLMSVRRPRGNISVLGVNVKSGQYVEQEDVPVFGKTTYLVNFDVASDDSQQIAGMQVFDDEQIIAFIENNSGSITQEQASPVKIVVVDETNTFFMDYVTVEGEKKRLLLTLLDLIHNEWLVKARYIAQGQEWVKAQGERGDEPKPVRMYEWEEEVGRWILKESFKRL